MLKILHVKVLPEALRDTTVTIAINDHDYLLDIRVSWRIKLGYLISKVGIWLVGTGLRLAGINFDEERVK